MCRRVVQGASPPELEVPIKKFERRADPVGFEEKRVAVSKTIDFVFNAKVEIVLVAVPVGECA